MSRATTARAVLAPVVLGVSGRLVATPPRDPGPDVRGGTQIARKKSLHTRTGYRR